MTSDTIQEVERDIAMAKQSIELAVALARLKDNRDFKSVVLDGYFKDEAVRLVHLKADPHFQSTEMQQSILAQINAIGALHEYFKVIEFHARQAAKAIEAGEQTIEELNAEGR